MTEKLIRLELAIPRDLYEWLRDVAREAGHGQSAKAARDLLEGLRQDDQAAHGRADAAGEGA